jgi:hypothetical protein
MKSSKLSNEEESSQVWFPASSNLAGFLERWVGQQHDICPGHMSPEGDTKSKPMRGTSCSILCLQPLVINLAHN